MSDSSPFVTVLITAVLIIGIGAVWGALHCGKIGFFLYCT